jgi:aminobenzoyl-glutamate utilization protein B
MGHLSGTEQKKELMDMIDAKAGIFTGASDKIWEFAETRFDLARSADLFISILTDEGFEIERGVACMDDAFVATWGHGGPVIGFLAEYDALSNLSQEQDALEQRPLEQGAAGHGCGHNLLGAGVLAAVIGLKDFLLKNPRNATIKLFGCPAEESGSGKAFMAREGVFGGTDAMFTWHPWTELKIWGSSSLANYQVCFNFKGVSSHAAASPEAGRSALDAAELMSVGVNYLREHIVQEARIHYAYLNAGGKSPNVVQSDASVLYFIRAPRSSQVKTIFERVVDIARGAALMAGVTMDIEWDSACAEFVINDTLGKILYKNMEALGDIEYTKSEQDYAMEYVRALGRGAEGKIAEILRTSFPAIGEKEVSKLTSKGILGCLFPYSMTDAAMPGSTDVSDASWISPTAQLLVTCFPAGTVPHSWQWVSTGRSSAAHKGLIYAGKAMAMSALDTIDDPELIERAKEEHKTRLRGETYKCAIPAEVKPR